MGQGPHVPETVGAEGLEGKRKVWQSVRGTQGDISEGARKLERG